MHCIIKLFYPRFVLGVLRKTMPSLNRAVCFCIDLFLVTAEGRDLCLVKGTTNCLAPSPDPEGKHVQYFPI